MKQGHFFLVFQALLQRNPETYSQSQHLKSLKLYIHSLTPSSTKNIMVSQESSPAQAPQHQKATRNNHIYSLQDVRSDSTWHRPEGQWRGKGKARGGRKSNRGRDGNYSSFSCQDSNGYILDDSGSQPKRTILDPKVEYVHGLLGPKMLDSPPITDWPAAAITAQNY